MHPLQIIQEMNSLVTFNLPHLVPSTTNISCLKSHELDQNKNHSKLMSLKPFKCSMVYLTSHISA